MGQVCKTLLILDPHLPRAVNRVETHKKKNRLVRMTIDEFNRLSGKTIAETFVALPQRPPILGLAGTESGILYRIAADVVAIGLRPVIRFPLDKIVNLVKHCFRATNDVPLADQTCDVASTAQQFG